MEPRSLTHAEFESLRRQHPDLWYMKARCVAPGPDCGETAMAYFLMRKGVSHSWGLNSRGHRVILTKEFCYPALVVQVDRLSHPKAYGWHEVDQRSWHLGVPAYWLGPEQDHDHPQNPQVAKLTDQRRATL